MDAFSLSRIHAVRFGEHARPLAPHFNEVKVGVAGSNATFSVVHSGTLLFACQRRFNEVNLANATNSALLLTNVQPI